VTATFIARLSAFILALVIGVAGIGAYVYAGGAPAADTTYARQQPTLVPMPTLVPAPAAVEVDIRDVDTRIETDPFIRTELFFGSARAGGEVTEAEFKQFLDGVVTPCFPDGLTLLTGKGQFRESGGEIVQETSFVLVLLYPLGARDESDTKIEAIRTLYKEHFAQQSVLRVDDPRAVRVWF